MTNNRPQWGLEKPNGSIASDPICILTHGKINASLKTFMTKYAAFKLPYNFHLVFTVLRKNSFAFLWPSLAFFGSNSDLDTSRPPIQEYTMI